MASILDYIDGNGGVDRIYAGAGDDIVALNLDDNGGTIDLDKAVFDGGSGVDTLVISWKMLLVQSIYRI